MYAKVFNFRFAGLSEAKVAASFCADNLGKKIIDNNIRSLNISIGQCGSVSINLKFETGDDLKEFDKKSSSFFKDLKKTFVFKENNFSGVFVFNYEAELTSTDIKFN